jgi:hypothetical protein
MGTRGLFALIGLVTLGSGCSFFASLEPNQTGMGVAQISSLGVGALVDVVSTNTECGFMSTAVMDAGLVTGQAGQPTQVVYTVSNCTIDLGSAPKAISTDCNGDALMASGKATFHAPLGRQRLHRSLQYADVQRHLQQHQVLRGERSEHQGAGI